MPGLDHGHGAGCGAKDGADVLPGHEALQGSRGACRLPPTQNRGFRRQFGPPFGLSLRVWKLEIPEMETDTKDDVLDRFQVAVQRLGETNREFREKLTIFAAGHGPYPAPEEWQHRWQLQATIDRLRLELEQFTARSSRTRPPMPRGWWPSYRGR